MKALLQRFTQWFYGLHKRSGTLWEGRFKSVIGLAPLSLGGKSFPPPEMIV